ncbi:MAG TPA: bifunctional cytidylyltransferase/SDR family oxidoreductase [Streptosporangiaceae bacterium]|jgi:2-C-methyl-D-erythritol 4-phosphate cytidylyltransferase
MRERGSSSRPGTVAVVLAGGTGQRIGLRIPKQLIKIAGKPIIAHTLAIFEAAPEVDHVIVMMSPDHIADVEKIAADAGFAKITAILPGGATRNDTTRRAIAAVEGLGLGDCNVLFHDAVRPLLSQRIIHDCVKALRTHRAVDVAIPSSDTVIVTDGDVITGIPDRSRLRRGQTPQGFRLSTIRRAYDLAAGDPAFDATDDCGVVLRYLPGEPIHVVAGDEQNMKVTQPVDIYLTDKLFQLSSQGLPRRRTEDEYTERLAGRTLVVFGGSYGIGADVARLGEAYGANAFAFSRGGTGTHVENAADVRAALESVYDATGRVDYVVNTAGVLRVGPLVAADPETVEEAIRVNLLAPIHIARASHPYLAETGGQLLLYTSSSYTRGRGDYSLYSSAKAAVVNLAQALADEWAADGVRINCVNPERTSTPMRSSAFGEEPPESLLSSEAVARTSIDVLLSTLTGHVVDVLRHDPLQPRGASEADAPGRSPRGEKSRT